MKKILIVFLLIIFTTGCQDNSIKIDTATTVDDVQFAELSVTDVSLKITDEGSVFSCKVKNVTPEDLIMKRFEVMFYEGDKDVAMRQIEMDKIKSGETKKISFKIKRDLSNVDDIIYSYYH